MPLIWGLTPPQGDGSCDSWAQCKVGSGSIRRFGLWHSSDRTHHHHCRNGRNDSHETASHRTIKRQQSGCTSNSCHCAPDPVIQWRDRNSADQHHEDQCNKSRCLTQRCDQDCRHTARCATPAIICDSVHHGSRERNNYFHRVGATGLEPGTSTMS